ncbi:MAG: hypothetical protein NTY48_03100, partial [Candidatus Diapherotrites archaeon]|nr:hypothetical protein [Candidatus Diapherotrites archaeon]
ETKKSSVQFTNSQDANFSPLDFNISVDSHVSFLEDGINIGTYDWRDLTETKYPTRTTTYKKDGKTYVKTVITAIIPANSTITLDPTYDLSLSTNYAVRWVGPYSGGTDFFYIGASNGSGQGVQLVNVDGGTYSNDLLITAYNAGNSHGNGVGNGAVYLIKNIDNLSGSKDMASGSSYNVVWNGAGSSAKLGSTSNSGLGVQLANVDNGAYANDLLLTAYYGTANSKSSNGTVFLIRNIDGLSGDKYLTNSTDYNVLWNGGTASDYLGSTNGSGLGVQLVNVDGNTYSNDLLITGYYVSVNSKTRNGAVYLIKDIDSLSGAKDLSSSSNYTVMWAGGGAAASDYLGYTTNSGSSGSGLGVQLVNVDGGIFSNDLLLTAVNADVNSKSNDGAVYLIRNIDGLSGGKYLNSSSDYNVMWNGGAASDYLRGVLV